MEAGVAVWIKDEDGGEAWLPGFISSKESVDEKTVITVKNEERQLEATFEIDDESIELDEVKLQNDSSESMTENLINLPYLHEPAILYCLEKRYDEGLIYTYTGPILIALNPFKTVPLYTPQILESYYNLGLMKSQGIETGTALSPHVYAIADAAYRDMMTSMSSNAISSRKGSPMKTGKEASASANQCILISGESGAGKTESTKIVLKYLTTVGNSSGGTQLQTGSVMDKILQSNPILEAFGNARTLRNDNSSRFGKFIELNFNRRGHLVGGTIRTYLLEKVRLPFQQSGERNFHIFYQMCAGRSTEQAAEWALPSVEEIFYANQGSVYQLKHMDDEKEFHHMQTAMDILNFPHSSQKELMAIVAGLMHLGEVQFVADAEGEGSAPAGEPKTTEAIAHVSRLLGVPEDGLLAVFATKKIKTVGETLVRKLNPNQANDARDALAKAVYGRLFDWLVRTINKGIQVDPSNVRADIGVLDIFGFECFKKNSFEQLCINYTNETLQQQFNQFVFKLEQSEYEREKIKWSFIEFPDNQDCLDLIEHKLNGIFAMLDDECRLPGATDIKLASRMFKAINSPRFSASTTQKRDSMFCIKHYAGPVVYSTITFVEKNKDEVPGEADALMQASAVPLLAHVFQFAAEEAAAAARAAEAKSGGKRSKSGGSVSVSAQFKGQLSSLMEKIYSTSPHYVRCLKPNDENVSDNFNRLRTTEQLRYGGVLEAVRVARSGFPVRLSHSDFYSRYRPLANPFSDLTAKMPRHIFSESPAKTQEYLDMLIMALWDTTTPDDTTTTPGTRRKSRAADLSIWSGKNINSEESLQRGLTKVFLRKQAHDILESRRSRRLSSCVVKIQTAYRRFFVRMWFLHTVHAARLIQRVIRGMVARLKYYKLRTFSAALKLQSQARRFIARCRFIHCMQAVVYIQSFLRGNKAKKMFVTQKRFNASVVVVQCAMRRRLARKVLKQFRMEAKDLGKLKQSNETLKAEIDMLRQKAMEEARIAAEKAAAEAAAAKEAEMERVLREFAPVQSQLEEESSKRASAEERIADLEAALEVMRVTLASTEGRAEKAEASVVEAKARILELDDSLKAALDYGAETSQHAEEMAERADHFQDKCREMENKAAQLEMSFAETCRLLESSNDPAVDSVRVKQLEFKISSLEEALAETNQRRHSAVHELNDTVSSTNSDDLAAAEKRILEQEGKILRLEKLLRGSRSNSMDGMNPPTPYKAEGEGAKAELKAAEETIMSLRRSSKESETKYRQHIRELEGQLRAAGLEPSSAMPRPTDDFFVPPSSQLNSVASPMPSIASTIEAPRDYTEAIEVLGKERAGRLALEEELSRLRNISLDLRTQVETLKMTQKSAAPASSLSAPSRRPDINPRGGKALSRTGSGNGTSMSGLRDADEEIIFTPAPSQPGNSARLVRSSSGGQAKRGSMAKSQDTLSSTNTAENTFQKNLGHFRARLHQGVKAKIWEGQRIVGAEATVQLDAKNEYIVFEQPRRLTLFFATRTEINNLRISDIYECIPGAEVSHDVSDSSRLLTIVTKSESAAARILAVQLGSREERNSFLTGLRTLVSDFHVAKTKSPTKMLVDVTESSKAGKPVVGALSPVEEPSSPTSPRSPMSARTRRRSALLHKEQKEPSDSETSRDPSPMRSGARRPSNPTPLVNANLPVTPSAVSGEDIANMNPSALKKQLLNERANHERMMVQMLMLTNDLNERDEQIADLKQREAALQQALADRERQHESDAMVRLQLGKRLEQVLMDKEEAMDQLELVREQLNAVRASFDVITGGSGHGSTSGAGGSNPASSHGLTSPAGSVNNRSMNAMEPISPRTPQHSPRGF